MQYKMRIETGIDASLIERICRIIRVRGFRIDQLEMQRKPLHFHYQFELSGDRNVENLKAQVSKLHGLIVITT